LNKAGIELVLMAAVASLLELMFGFDLFNAPDKYHSAV
jgi:hypothetical protein